MRDLHSSLAPPVVDRRPFNGGEIALVRLQFGRSDFQSAIHVRVTTFNRVKHELTDFLAGLGFGASECPFLPGSQCQAAPVADDFDLEAFSTVLPGAWHLMQSAAMSFRNCGIEFWDPQSPPRLMDAHISRQPEQKGSSSSPLFDFRLSWLDTDQAKGWVIHYHPNVPDHWAELPQAFAVLKLPLYDECAYFNFEPCYWRFIPAGPPERVGWPRMAGIVQGWFGATPPNFPPGITHLIEAHRALQPFGFHVLPTAAQHLRPRPLQPVGSGTVSPRQQQTAPGPGAKRDLFLCHAGPDKEAYVRPLAAALAQYDITCWVDEAEIKLGDGILRKVQNGLKVSRYVLVFLTESFTGREWPERELDAALSKELRSGETVVLPVMCTDADLVFDRYPLLADKMHSRWDRGVDAVVRDILVRLDRLA